MWVAAKEFWTVGLMAEMRAVLTAERWVVALAVQWAVVRAVPLVEWVCW